jgi:hypothetical protein
VLLSVVYVALQRILQLISLLFRSSDSKELEIVVLRHEVAVFAVRSSDRGSAGRPMVLSGGQPTLAARPMVPISGHVKGAETPIRSRCRVGETTGMDS